MPDHTEKTDSVNAHTGNQGGVAENSYTHIRAATRVSALPVELQLLLHLPLIDSAVDPLISAAGGVAGTATPAPDCMRVELQTLPHPPLHLSIGGMRMGLGWSRYNIPTPVPCRRVELQTLLHRSDYHFTHAEEAHSIFSWTVAQQSPVGGVAVTATPKDRPAGGVAATATPKDVRRVESQRSATLA